jgi:hypothetical protein
MVKFERRHYKMRRVHLVENLFLFLLAIFGAPIFLLFVLILAGDPAMSEIYHKIPVGMIAVGITYTILALSWMVATIVVCKALIPAARRWNRLGRGRTPRSSFYINVPRRDI